MMASTGLVFILLFALSNAQTYEFPEGFKFGVATASYQIEGAWNTSGKGENIWDHLTHERSEMILDRSTGDIACDAYHKTKEDVQLLKDLGVNFYRFSISWSRILPSGFVNNINEDGIRYYNELIDELLANGITPYVTIYHWDLPQPLQEIGGWPNPLLSDHFVDYARVLFENFGDRVTEWITFNEPIQTCDQGYGIASMAPAYTSDGIASYLCSKTLLVAHGKTYRMYDAEFRDTQKGRVGITIDSNWNEPETNSTNDIDAAERVMQMDYAWWTHPILSKTGDFPPIMHERIDRISAEEGFTSSRLPKFTPEEITMIQGSYDFLGLNHYTTRVVTNDENDVNKHPSHNSDIGAITWQRDEWESTAADWLKVVPWGLRNLLKWIKEEFDNPEVIITENGYADYDTNDLHDCRRIHYYNAYLEQVLLAIHEDGCNVTGYTAWSFMDNFEWMRGYTQRFGLYYVDFEDDNRPRVPKMSSHVFTNIIKTSKIDWDYTPSGFDACEW